MVDTHKRDPSWETDLIWHYFHGVHTTANPGQYKNFYRDMDPTGQLSDRHRVYELLVDEPDQTSPSTDDEVGKSKIPWNQNNAGFLKSIGGGAEWCGSIVKMVFIRYMGWTREPRARSVNERGFDAASWTIDKLKNNIPVRVGFGGSHYVGIVGHHCVIRPLPAGASGPSECGRDNDFLCIEPWAGGVDATASITYAGTSTGFLGIIQQRGPMWKYGRLTATWVEV
jgi:hypothetical protein